MPIFKQIKSLLFKFSFIESDNAYNNNWTSWYSFYLIYSESGLDKQIENTNNLWEYYSYSD